MHGMAIFGNPNGGPFPLGKLTVATSGTPILLTSNLTYKFDGLGHPLRAQQIRVNAPSGNAGDVYLVFKGSGYAANNGQSVVLLIPKGTERFIEAKNQNNPFQPDNYGIDGTAGDAAFVTLVIA